MTLSFLKILIYSSFGNDEPVHLAHLPKIEIISAAKLFIRKRDCNICLQASNEHHLDHGIISPHVCATYIAAAILYMCRACVHAICATCVCCCQHALLPLSSFLFTEKINI